MSGSTSTSVSIRKNASNEPGDLVATLTNPSNLSRNSLNTFTAPVGTRLDGASNDLLDNRERGNLKPGAFIAHIRQMRRAARRAGGSATTVYIEAAIRKAGSIRNRLLSSQSKALPASPPPTPRAQPSISGTAQVGQTLTAGIGDIADAEDLPSTVFPAGYTFQWVRVDSSNNETDVGTDSSTYSPTSSDVGSTIKVKVSFIDNAGNPEGPLPSDAYPSEPPGATVVAAQGSCPSDNDWCATLTMGYDPVFGRSSALSRFRLYLQFEFRRSRPGHVHPRADGVHRYGTSIVYLSTSLNGNTILTGTP